MLTEAEKYGISELLSRLSVSDLQSLAQTVTSKLLVPETSVCDLLLLRALVYQGR